MKDIIMKMIVALGFTLILAGPAQSAFTHPSTMLNQEEIDAIKTKLNQEPWKSAYNKMINMANSWLGKGTLNVLAGKTPPSGNKREFWNDKGYSGGDRTDYSNAHKVKEAVQTLGLAYAFTGDAKYAEKAISFIYAWFLHPTTGMLPDKLENGQPTLDASITLPGVYYGADLIWNYPGWKATDKKAFQDWVRTLQRKYYNPNPTSTSVGNNWQDWKHSMMAFSAVIYEDMQVLQNAFKLVKYVIPQKMNSQGRMEAEYTRGGNGGISYSLYALGPQLQVAEIARHHGVDLYNYSLGGKSIELACDFMAPYCSNVSSWPWKAGGWSANGGDGTGVFEYINFFKQKPAYKTFLNKSRAIFDFRVSGHMTLTHAAGARPWKVYSGSGSGSTPPTNLITIEAEEMTLTNGYMVDTGDKLNSTAIFVDPQLPIPSTGKATAAFSGENGIYTIILSTIPENDGAPTIKLYVDNNLLINETYPIDASFYNLQMRIEYEVSGVSISKGDPILIEGTSAYLTGGAFARVDKVIFLRTSGALALNNLITQLPIEIYTGPKQIFTLSGQSVFDINSLLAPGMYIIQEGGRITTFMKLR